MDESARPANSSQVQTRSSAEIIVSFKKFNVQEEDFSTKPRITVITLGVNEMMTSWSKPEEQAQP